MPPKNLPNQNKLLEKEQPKTTKNVSYGFGTCNRASTSRAAETNEERESRLEDLRNRASMSRAAETNEEREFTA